MLVLFLPLRYETLKKFSISFLQAFGVPVTWEHRGELLTSKGKMWLFSSALASI